LPLLLICADGWTDGHITRTATPAPKPQQKAGLFMLQQVLLLVVGFGELDIDTPRNYHGHHRLMSLSDSTAAVGAFRTGALLLLPAVAGRSIATPAWMRIQQPVMGPASWGRHQRLSLSLSAWRDVATARRRVTWVVVVSGGVPRPGTAGDPVTRGRPIICVSENISRI
jgi:hypothetical protein